MSQKTIIMIVMSVGVTLGAVLPLLWGDRDPLGGASILWGFIGGAVGIWIGAKVAKQPR